MVGPIVGSRIDYNSYLRHLHFQQSALEQSVQALRFYNEIVRSTHTHTHFRVIISGSFRFRPLTSITAIPVQGVFNILQTIYLTYLLFYVRT